MGQARFPFLIPCRAQGADTLAKTLVRRGKGEERTSFLFNCSAQPRTIIPVGRTNMSRCPCVYLAHLLTPEEGCFWIWLLTVFDLKMASLFHCSCSLLQ